tara:strand:- start:188 stop:808 length:621 start_codon:yes stop_codon:yes gene_type:complete
VNNKIKVFPNYVYKFKVPNYNTLNKKLKSEIYKLKEENQEGVVKSNYGGWHSKGLKGENFKDLIEIISDFFSKQILNINGIIKPHKIWSCVNEKNNYNEGHTHGRHTYYSGVYYVKIPKNSGNLYFMDTHWDPDLITLYYDIYKAENSIKEVEIKSKEGDLYFFRGKLPHRVGTNFSDEDRISISFNFNYEDISQQAKEKGIKWIS